MSQFPGHRLVNPYDVGTEPTTASGAVVRAVLAVAGAAGAAALGAGVAAAEDLPGDDDATVATGADATVATGADASTGSSDLFASAAGGTSSAPDADPTPTSADPIPTFDDPIGIDDPIDIGGTGAVTPLDPSSTSGAGFAGSTPPNAVTDTGTGAPTTEPVLLAAVDGATPTDPEPTPAPATVPSDELPPAEVLDLGPLGGTPTGELPAGGLSTGGTPTDGTPTAVPSFAAGVGASAAIGASTVQDGDPVPIPEQVLPPEQVEDVPTAAPASSATPSDDAGGADRPVADALPTGGPEVIPAGSDLGAPDVVTGPTTTPTDGQEPPVVAITGGAGSLLPPGEEPVLLASASTGNPGDPGDPDELENIEGFGNAENPVDAEGPDDPEDPDTPPGATAGDGSTSGSTGIGRAQDPAPAGRPQLELPGTVFLTPEADFAALAEAADPRFRPTLEHLGATGGADLFDLQGYRREGVESERDWVYAIGEVGQQLRRFDLSVPGVPVAPAALADLDPADAEVPGAGTHTGLHCYLICRDGTAEVLSDPTAVLALDRAPFSAVGPLIAARPDRVARVDLLPFGQEPTITSADTAHRGVLSDALNGHPNTPPVEVYRANVAWDGTMVVAGPRPEYRGAPGVVAVTSVGGGPLASSVSVHGRKVPTDRLPVVGDETTTIESPAVTDLRQRTAAEAGLTHNEARIRALESQMRFDARTDLAALRRTLREQTGEPSPQQRQQLARLEAEVRRGAPTIRPLTGLPQPGAPRLEDVWPAALLEPVDLPTDATDATDGPDTRTAEEWFEQESLRRPPPDDGAAGGPGPRHEGRVLGLDPSVGVHDPARDALVIGPETLREDPGLLQEVTPEQRPLMEYLATDEGARKLDELAGMRRPVGSGTEYREFVADVCYLLRECALRVPTPTPDDALRAYPSVSPDLLTDPDAVAPETLRRRMLEGSPLLETSTLVGLRDDGVAEVLNGDYFVGHPGRTGLGIDDRLFETDLSRYRTIDLLHVHPPLGRSTADLSPEDTAMAEYTARRIARATPQQVQFGYCSIDTICGTVTRYLIDGRHRQVEVFPGSPGLPVASEVEVGSTRLAVPEQVVTPLPDTFVEPRGTDDRIRRVTAPGVTGRDVLAAADRGELATTEPVRLVDDPAGRAGAGPGSGPTSATTTVGAVPTSVSTGTPVVPLPVGVRLPAAGTTPTPVLPASGGTGPGGTGSSGTGSSGGPRVGTDGVIDVEVLSSERIGTGRRVPSTRVAPAVPNGTYFTSPGGRTVRVPTATGGALLGAALSPALTPITQAIGLNPVEQRPAEPLRQVQAVAVDTGIGLVGGGPVGAITTGVTSAMTRTAPGQAVTAQARRYADSGADPGEVRRNALLGSLAGVPAQVANVTQLLGGGLQAAVETGVAGGAMAWDALDGRMELSPEQYAEALMAMPGHTTTRQMLHRTAEQSAVNWRHTGDLITGRVEPGRAQPGQQHPVCASDGDRNCIEPSSLTGFNAGVLRVGPATVGPAVVGPRIVGSCAPGHPAYASCVAAGTAGVPAYGQGVGVGYVGDGSDSPGNQLEVAARTAADPRALGREVSRYVNSEIDKVRANPMHLLNYLPR